MVVFSNANAMREISGPARRPTGAPVKATMPSRTLRPLNGRAGTRPVSRKQARV